MLLFREGNNQGENNSGETEFGEEWRKMEKSGESGEEQRKKKFQPIKSAEHFGKRKSKILFCDIRIRPNISKSLEAKWRKKCMGGEKWRKVAKSGEKWRKWRRVEKQILNGE